MTSVFARWVIVPILLVCFAAGSARPQGAASAVINNLHEALLQVMKEAETLGAQGRYQRLEPTIKETYDFGRMVAIIAGSSWQAADGDQRARLRQAFERSSISTYAARFNGYSGERFEVLGERPGPRGAVLVDTQIVRPNAEPVPITYVMIESDQHWRVVDVLLEKSISELAVRRSEYNQILRDGGTDRLAATLQAKADETLASPPPK